jgi:hypothetical protein
MWPNTTLEMLYIKHNSLIQINSMLYSLYIQSNLYIKGTDKGT